MLADQKYSLKGMMRNMLACIVRDVRKKVQDEILDVVIGDKLRRCFALRRQWVSDRIYLLHSEQVLVTANGKRNVSWKVPSEAVYIPGDGGFGKPLGMSTREYLFEIKSV